MDLITFQVDKDFYENYQKNNHGIYVELINDQQSQIRSLITLELFLMRCFESIESKGS